MEALHYIGLVRKVIESIEIRKRKQPNKLMKMKLNWNLGHLELVKLYLHKEGLDINGKNLLGRTALHESSRYGN